jgi:hypothetical protein
MAFQEIENSVWSYSDPILVSGTNEINTSIDGSAIRLDFAAANESATLTFDAVDLSAWEELIVYFMLGDQLTTADLFRVTIDSVDYDFGREDFKKTGRWNQFIFDCSVMGTVSTIQITALVADLVLLIDYVGYRRVTYNMDVDIIEALKDHIILDYDTATTLSAGAAAGATTISLTSNAYLTETSFLELDDGDGNTETVQLEDFPSVDLYLFCWR